jgi:hypothetical protein
LDVQRRAYADPVMRTVEIDVLRAGQPRPYADSEWEAILAFLGEGGWGKPNEQFVKRAAQVRYERREGAQVM